MSSNNGDNRKRQQQPKQRSNKRRRRKAHTKPFSTLFKSLIVLGILLVFAIGGAGIGAYIAIIKNIPDLGLVAIQPNAYTSIIYDSKGNEIDRLHGDENREYASLDNIPQYMQDAVIAIEDERFYQHDGVDARGFARAVYSTVTGQQMQGGSTITQQLIKNNVTKMTHNNVITKLQEQYLATKYEKELAKQLGSKEAAKKYILELYLNTIALGHGYNGVQAAALGYYNKDASQLDLAECASLAGVTNNPSVYSPRTQPENNKSRQSIILRYMLDQGYITQEEKDVADVEDIYSKIAAADSMDMEEEQDSENIHSYFVDAMFEQISTDLQNKYNMSRTQAEYVLYNGGLQITSTVDLDMQKKVDEVFLNPNAFPSMVYNYDISYRVSIEDSTTGEQTHSEYKQFARSMDSAQQWVAEKKTAIEAGLTPTQKIIADKAVYNIQPQAAMAIMDYHNGEVKAIAGGRDKKLVNRGFNRATDATRQPGSVFKVLAAYAPAIDTGKITAATLIKDEPYTIGDYSPKNWWGNSYRGECTARVGIRDSMNILAVKTMVEMAGIDTAYDYLLNFGFTTLEDDNHASTALGGIANGVTQVEVAAAYGTIANGGEYKRPMFYSMVLDHDGNVLLENNSEPRQVLKATSAYILTQMMSSVVNDPKGTGTAAKFRNSKMPVVGKTGTTTNTKDLTFVGYTPYYVGSIWFGYDRYDTTVPNMDKFLRNQHCHLDVWRDVMEKVHEGLEVKDFAQPDGIKEVKICANSGKLPNGGCTTITEYFADGTQPTKYCNGHNSGSDGDDKSDENSDNNEVDENNTNNDDSTTAVRDGEGDTTPAGGENGDTQQVPDTQTPSVSEPPAQEQTSAQTEPAPEPEPTPVQEPEAPAVENVIVEPTVSAG